MVVLSQKGITAPEFNLFVKMFAYWLLFEELRFYLVFLVN